MVFYLIAEFTKNFIAGVFKSRKDADTQIFLYTLRLRVFARLFFKIRKPMSLCSSEPLNLFKELILQTISESFSLNLNTSPDEVLKFVLPNF